MAELDIAAIINRLYEASGGPWELVGSSTPYMDGKAGYHIRAEGQPGMRITLTCHPGDAELIAHAREDIERLLNRVSELEHEVSALEVDLDSAKEALWDEMYGYRGDDA